ncbi:MAG TPA: hypothetical protein PKV98_01695 [Burkholderiaceae bacterium]|nr:hypothetical protein [Burkholderiaceae bacterium]
MRREDNNLQDFNKAAVLAALRALNVSTIRVTYSGSGDSGQLDQVDVEPPLPENPAPVEMKEREYVKFDEVARCWETAEKLVERPLEDAVESLCWDAIEAHCSGFENNDGGDGTWVLDVATGKYTLDHTNYYTESYSETFEG